MRINERSALLQWLFYAGIATFMALCLHFIGSVPWSFSVLVGFIGFPIISALQGDRGDVPTYFWGPHGNRKQPIWRRSEFWAQLSFGCSVSLMVKTLEVTDGRIAFGTLAICFLIIFALILGFTPNKRSETKADVASLIRTFLDGTCKDWDWDDFTLIKHPNPEIESVRRNLLAIRDKYPPNKAGEHCSEEGRRALQEIADALLRDQPPAPPAETKQ